MPGVLADARPDATTWPRPRIGEHTRGILSGLGYGDEEVDRLVARGAVPVDGEG
jgi:crotonobetainyl-CoA:carnitine CoA-transferase CaiB-like acyl-CoA transferase